MKLGHGIIIALVIVGVLIYLHSKGKIAIPGLAAPNLPVK